MAKKSRSQKKQAKDELHETIMEFMQERRGVFGLDASDAVSYVKQKLGLECGKNKILRAFHSLSHKRKLTHVKVDPSRGLNDMYGNKRVLFHIPNTPENEFPEEYREFVAQIARERSPAAA